MYLRNTFPNFFADLDLLAKDCYINDKYRALERAIYNSISKPLC